MMSPLVFCLLLSISLPLTLGGVTRRDAQPEAEPEAQPDRSKTTISTHKICWVLTTGTFKCIFSYIEKLGWMLLKHMDFIQNALLLRSVRYFCTIKLV
jgi:hypothetical protein